MTKEQLEFLNIMTELRKLNISSMLPEITMGEFDILKRIEDVKGEDGRARISCVVRSMCMPPPAISRAMGILETKGYIRRDVDRRDPGDLRLERRGPFPEEPPPIIKGSPGKGRFDGSGN